MPAPVVRRSPPRSRRAITTAVTLACVSLATAWTRPAAAQDSTASGCQCGDAAERAKERERAWWLPALLLPLLGAPMDWGSANPSGGAPTLAGRAGPAAPAELVEVTEPLPGVAGLTPAPAAPAIGRPARGKAGAPRLDAPRAANAREPGGLTAPATATARPTVAAVGAALLLLALTLRRARTRRAAAAAAAAAANAATARPAPTTPRVLLTPPRPTAAPSRTSGRASVRRLAAAERTLVATGVACLVGVGLSFVRGAVAAWEVRSNWAKPTAQAAVPSGGLEIAAVARLEIPAIGLTRLVGEGIDERTLAAGPGHLPETVAPGLADLSVISAHRDLDFRRLGRVHVGDTVVTTTRTRRTVWRVVERAVVAKDSAALRPAAGHARLALTTCWPIRYFGRAPERLLVFADPIRSEPAPPEPVRLATR